MPAAVAELPYLACHSRRNLDRHLSRSVRQNRERAERLAKALSQINATVTTNAPSAFPGADRPVAATPHRNVSVVVIQ